jgi:iron complex transport system ATP-binding protein
MVENPVKYSNRKESPEFSKLEVRNLDVYYNSTRILKQINFSANKGEFIGLIGANGSGKTTLLKAVVRILKPEAGCVLFDGKNIIGMSIKEIAKNIAVVPQSISIDFDFTVEEIVLMGRTPYIKAQEKIEDIKITTQAMKHTNTYHLKNRLITEISGGELQRVVIARALAQEPVILLLDEPTSHLDLNHQIEILKLLKCFSRKGLIIIAVIHDLNMAAYYCDKIILLKNGAISSTGSPEQVLTTNNIGHAFGIEVQVENNPLTNSLFVFPKLKT